MTSLTWLLFVRFEQQSGTWRGVLLLWSIHFKIWVVVWFKMHSCTSLWYRAVTCIFVAHLSAWTNLVALLWPRLAKRLFCPQTCHWLEAFLFVCSYVLLMAPFWLNWSFCSEWTSQKSECVYIGISTSGIKHHTTFKVAQITSSPFYHLVKELLNLSTLFACFTLMYY